jgi:hypothetical protein
MRTVFDTRQLSVGQFGPGNGKRFFTTVPRMRGQSPTTLMRQ